jgi:hypothetical protein
MNDTEGKALVKLEGKVIIYERLYEKDNVK